MKGIFWGEGSVLKVILWRDCSVLNKEGVLSPVVREGRKFSFSPRWGRESPKESLKVGVLELLNY